MLQRWISNFLLRKWLGYDDPPIPATTETNSNLETGVWRPLTADRFPVTARLMNVQSHDEHNLVTLFHQHLSASISINQHQHQNLSLNIPGASRSCSYCYRNFPREIFCGQANRIRTNRSCYFDCQWKRLVRGKQNNTSRVKILNWNGCAGILPLVVREVSQDRYRCLGGKGSPVLRRHEDAVRLVQA